MIQLAYHSVTDLVAEVSQDLALQTTGEWGVCWFQLPTGEMSEHGYERQRMHVMVYHLHTEYGLATFRYATVAVRGFFVDGQGKNIPPARRPEETLNHIRAQAKSAAMVTRDWLADQGVAGVGSAVPVPIPPLEIQAEWPFMVLNEQSWLYERRSG